ncbi:uncharacterized protein EI90DRAFT_3139121 [Cantharellus anzutake]|uniref:uncharacterized protein n=1 Tax=Cantharellus anzutake TaxID=1750568 RepID=UPI0019083961|nr:uncharacterized protein EI90DRAFT_3139121 [Cantharellus anzutake]KAF8310815.1 hypothetical protein EI90DRAFT_3139121 [Cantharellus anzutake]
MIDPLRLAAHIASTQITENNPQSSWNRSEVKLSDLPWIIKRTRLPHDWICRENMGDALTQTLTTWLQNTYNISDARFHLSLIAALILTAWAPNHGIKHQKDEVPIKVAKNANMVEYASTLAWECERGRAGWVAKAPLFHFWLIFISGVLVENSPWWQLTNEKLEVKSTRVQNRTDAQLANRDILKNFQTKIQHKGLYVSVLCRLNLVAAHTPNAFKNPCYYRKDWELHSLHELESSVATVTKHLAAPAERCPVFCAVSHFLGDQCRSRRASDQSLRADSESSSEENGFNARAHPRPRKRTRVE